MADAGLEQAKKIADAVLYEGYLLYPYRLSSLKNRQRWTFGSLYPQVYSESRGSVDAWFMQTECLVLGHAETLLGVRARFLQVGQESSGSVLEPVEREVIVPGLPVGEVISGSRSLAFSFSPIAGAVELSAERVGDACFKLSVRVVNHSPWDGASQNGWEDVLPYILGSAHAILEVRKGQFTSLLDPPDPLRRLAAECRNVGTWPVLVGNAGERDRVLSAPIVLPDYPRVAPESPGDLFDGTEIDELLTLRILTLTESERREMRALDDRSRALLDRTEALDGGQLLSLHGTMRDSRSDTTGVAHFKPGDRVRLRPRGGADAFDLVLAGRTATVAAVEQDYEGQVHLAVTVDEDPGKDLGEQGKPGHRFFFRPEEVELLAALERTEP
jgi:hypothetical protein